MDKLKMHSPDLTQDNIAKIRALFPGCVTEAADENGKLRLAVDFDQLKQELSDSIVEGPQERYHLNWPGKREALITANAPIAKTLRPARDESVDFDTTQNLFIEGDNLEALKLLQETYLGKVKMIYIDPPYNTGNDFVYDDDFAESSAEFFERSNQKDDEGNRLVANTATNGRFHSDWLSMIASRLWIAKRLLHEEGAIFVSIDENEAPSLRKLCDEVFGAENYRNSIIVRRRVKSLNVQFADNGLSSLNVGFEYVLVYGKSPSFLMNALQAPKVNAKKTGTWNVFWSGADRPTMRYELLGFTPSTGQWRWSKEKAVEGVKNYNEYLANYSDSLTLEEYWAKTGSSKRFVRRIEGGEGKNGGVQYWIAPSDTALRSSNWMDIEVSEIRKEFDLPFSNPKSVKLMQEIVKLSRDPSALILDFFAGSGTTAQAVLQQNAADGGMRRIFSVQIPEALKEIGHVNEAHFSSLADVSKERIRRAGQKILEGECHPDWNKDVGFRVLKIDSSNMADVFYTPDQTSQADLLARVDNVKPDRTAEDLLFQVLLDWGVELTLPIRRETVQGKTVFFVDDTALMACFDDGISEDLVKELAGHAPLRIVFKDTGFADDQTKINVRQIFKAMSPETEVKAI